MQFAAREHHYREHYGGSAFDIVMEGGTPVGLLYVARWKDEIRIVDLAVMPEHRGRGIGTALLGNVLAEAEARGQPVTIHVERFNRAMSLYDRLGFVIVEDKGVYLLLERRPPPPTPQAKTAS
jgi:ribosomal protein S18 acetylase RimI-like enzyme